MSKYYKDVYRESDYIYYKIYRTSDKSLVAQKSFNYTAAGVILGMFASYEKCMGKVFKVAHKEAGIAINNLEKYEAVRLIEENL